MFTDYFHYLIYSHNKEMVENMIYGKQSLFCVSEVANMFCQLLIQKEKISVIYSIKCVFCRVLLLY